MSQQFTLMLKELMFSMFYSLSFYTQVFGFQFILKSKLEIYIFLDSDSESIVPRPAASAPPGNF